MSNDFIAAENLFSASNVVITNNICRDNHRCNSFSLSEIPLQKTCFAESGFLIGRQARLFGSTLRGSVRGGQ